MEKEETQDQESGQQAISFLSGIIKLEYGS